MIFAAHLILAEVDTKLTHHSSDISAISDHLDMTGQGDSRPSSGKEAAMTSHINGEGGLERGEGGFERWGVHDQNNVVSPGMDEQWIHQFRSSILQDRDLHLSILRYEVSIIINRMDI